MHEDKLELAKLVLIEEGNEILVNIENNTAKFTFDSYGNLNVLLSDVDNNKISFAVFDLVYNIDDLPFGKYVLPVLAFPFYLDEKTGRMISPTDNYYTGTVSSVSPMQTWGPVHVSSNHTWQIVPSSDVTYYKIQLLGSLDASKWFVLDEYEGNDNTPVMRHVANKPVLYMGIKLVDIEGSSVTVKILSAPW
ncbi:MAG: hypothetical protein J7J51_05215 [Candidatus Omnitrophica bacterium]|nr:hypothetical protein [Candidatus Omnitrophota bacterium]